MSNDIQVFNEQEVLGKQFKKKGQVYIVERLSKELSDNNA